MYHFEMKHEVTVKVMVISEDGIHWHLAEDGKRQFQEQIRQQIKEMYAQNGKKGK